ncbi:MAG: hypothetical protein PF690_08080 [Deltaproteobacteria bacterium]|nr:hypothetical protein [Deltaproteobacteria bacterium]
MIKNKFKIILLVWPIILLIGMYWYYSYERQQIDKKLLEADGLVWETNEKQFKTLIIQREDGELLHIQIKIIGPGSKEVFKTEETIDRDMFGGGFVRAAQVDNDPENEIIVWHARAKYYLDFVQGNVKKVSFDHVDQQIKDLAKNWHRYNVLAGLEMISLLFFVFCYYGLYLFIMMILKLIRRKSNG